MLIYLISLLSALSASIHHSLANPLTARWDNMRIKHDWGAVPTNWECLGVPSVGTTIALRIALKPWREDALIEVLNEVSDIRHAKYGAYLSREQVAELVAPHPDTLELINSWLEHHGVSPSSISRTHGGGWLTVSGVPVSQANELLGASYQLYRHVETNETILRTVSYAIPVALHTHVQTVAPTTHFASMRMLHQTPRKLSDGPAAFPRNAASGEPMNVTVLSPRRQIITNKVTRRVTLPLLRWMYSTETYEPAPVGNALGIAGFSGQYIRPGDLIEFMRRYRQDLPENAIFDFDVQEINGGGFNPSDPGFQASLDIQYAQGMAYPARHIFYSTGGSAPSIPDVNAPTDENEPYLDWLNHLAAPGIPPATISTSYVDDEQTVPQDYAEAVCDLFAQLGVRGATVLCPSGDHGVSGIGPDCTANDGSGNVRFLPTFPSSCPYVTSVGGSTYIDPEVAANFSGGGFSNYFPRPKYQNDAVSTFFNHLGSAYPGMYNPAGRGYPDLSLQAINYLVIYKGKTYYKINGTSLASSTTAGLISLVNDYLVRNGRPRLGFLNPWLYGHGVPGLGDIKYGSNPGCNTDGFSAVPGWDPITGLGSPNFQSLIFILDTRHQAQNQGGPRTVGGTIFS